MSTTGTNDAPAVSVEGHWIQCRGRCARAKHPAKFPLQEDGTRAQICVDCDTRKGLYQQSWRNQEDPEPVRVFRAPSWYYRRPGETVQ